MGRPKVYDRDKVLDATTQLFWEKGISETSLADIEKFTGVNKSSLYAEFTDKDDIFVASLKRYIENSGIYGLLVRKPLGKANLIEFLKWGKSCEGQRGCFVVNSVRESAIIPAQAKLLIQAHQKKIKSMLVKNVASSQFKGDAEVCSDLILTFNSGLCLELNAIKKSPVEKINAFVDMIGL